MINTDRIVPVQKIDLISLYALILKAAGNTLTALDADTVEGGFTVEEAPASGYYIASQPVQSLDIDSDVSAVTVFFVAAYDYAGISIGGTAVTPAGGSVTVVPDGVTLYKAVLATNAVTITKVGV